MIVLEEMCEEKKMAPMLPGSRLEPVKEQNAPQEMNFQSYCSIKLQQPQKEGEMVRDLEEGKRSDMVQGGAQEEGWNGCSSKEPAVGCLRDSETLF